MDGVETVRSILILASSSTNSHSFLPTLLRIYNARRLVVVDILLNVI